MSRTARNWCPRSTLPPLPLLIEVDDSSANESHVNKELKNEPMTWQQEKDFKGSPVSQGATSLPYRLQTAPKILHMKIIFPSTSTFSPHLQLTRDRASINLSLDVLTGNRCLSKNFPQYMSVPTIAG
jgi:hypothetical protein